MKIEKSLIRKVLEKLYEDYFPGSCYSDELTKALGMGTKEEAVENVETVAAYLGGKGLIVISEDGYAITAEGIDKLEGKSLI